MNQSKPQEQASRKSRTTKNGSRKLKRNIATLLYAVSLIVSLGVASRWMWLALIIQPIAIIALYNVYAFRARKMNQLNTFPVAYAVGISLHILFSLLLFVWLVTSAV